MAVVALLTMERLRTGVTYTPLGAQYWADPYPMYRPLQSRDPIHRSLLTKSWVVSRYDDVTAVLADSRFVVDERKLPTYERQRAEMIENGLMGEDEAATPSLLGLDPPDHTRLRSLVSKAFTPRAVEALRASVEAIVQECLDAVAVAGEMDVIRDLAYPLPVTVISQMLGVPAAERERFTHWSDALVRAIGYAGIDELSRSREAVRQFGAWLEDLAEERKRSPGDDLMSALLAAEEEGDKLSREEVLLTCRLLLNAGHVTTTHLIGNGLLALLRHPDQLNALRRDRSLIEGAVEELLRYDTPVQATSRFATEDVEMRGRKIEVGQRVILLLAAANRDPDQFSDPDRLDISRKNNHHLSFGHGIHRCLGAPLARLEAEVALAAIIDRFPKLRLATDRVQWGDHMFLRGLKTLPVAF